MPSSPEIPYRELLHCQDARGNPITIGAGSTKDGRVILLTPSGHAPLMNLQQATEYVHKLRLAIQDAAQRDG